MSSTTAAVAVTRSIIYLGMDVHKESITIAILPADAKTPTRVDRLPNDLPKLKRFLDRPSSFLLFQQHQRRVAGERFHDPVVLVRSGSDQVAPPLMGGLVRVQEFG